MVVYAVGVEMTPEQVAEMLQEIDPNGTGDVDFDEFVQAFRTQLDQSPRDILGNSHFGLEDFSVVRAIRAPCGKLRRGRFGALGW